jgi:hypothetical protein
MAFLLHSPCHRPLLLLQFIAQRIKLEQEAEARAAAAAVRAAAAAAKLRKEELER